MEQRTKRLTQTLGAVAIASGLGVGAVGLASAATSPSPPSSSAPATGSDQPGAEQDDDVLNGSVQVPEREEADDAADDATEQAELQKVAKVTAEQAEQAALAVVPGTVSDIELENEDGSVVYEVEITANGTTTEVEVDAGNAKVLAQEADHAEDADHADEKDEHGTE